MSVRIRIAGAIVLSGLALCALSALGADLSEVMRVQARILAGQEIPLAKRDLKGYCNATYGSPDYAAYAAGVCQMWVKNSGRKAEECAEANVRQAIRKDIERCMAMSEGEFDKQILIHARLREEFIRNMQEEGLDGEKLLQEERAKLP